MYSPLGSASGAQWHRDCRRLSFEAGRALKTLSEASDIASNPLENGPMITVPRESGPEVGCKPRKVRHAWIELTHQCNLECVHCYTVSGPRTRDHNKLSFDEYDKLLNDLRNSGCTSVQFIGGEPTLHPWLAALLRISRMLDYTIIEVFSNLTRLSDTTLETIVENGVRVACSVYSHDAVAHDAVTGRTGSFLRTVRNIERLVARGVSIRAGIVVIGDVNAGHSQATAEFLRGLGISDIKVDNVRRVGRPAKSLMTPKEAAVGELCGRCVDGSVCVDPQGVVTPCIMARAWRMGSVRDVPVDSLLGSSEWNELREALSSRDSTGIVVAGCSPEDTCGPGACHPQVGGPPDCMPQRSCMPELYPPER